MNLKNLNKEDERDYNSTLAKNATVQKELMIKLICNLIK